MKQTLPLYKLMILYFLDKARRAVSNAMLSGFFLEREYVNYFNLQQSLAQLHEDNLVQVEHTYNTTYYSITASGTQTVGFFGDDVSSQIKKDIDQYLLDNQYELATATSIKADYTRQDAHSYLAFCSISEREKLLFEIKLSVPDEETARMVCENFKQNSETLYQSLFEQLI